MEPWPWQAVCHMLNSAAHRGRDVWEVFETSSCSSEQQQAACYFITTGSTTPICMRVNQATHPAVGWCWPSHRIVYKSELTPTYSTYSTFNSPDLYSRVQSRGHSRLLLHPPEGSVAVHPVCLAWLHNALCTSGCGSACCFSPSPPLQVSTSEDI